MKASEYDSILQELQDNKIISSKAFVNKLHRGGTKDVVLEVYDQEQKIAVKVGSQKQCRHAVSFYHHYANITLFPTITFISGIKNFYAYKFIEGTKFNRSLFVDEIFFIVDHVINKYTRSPYTYWGNIDNPDSNILDFILNDIADSRDKIQNLLSAFEFDKVSAIVKNYFLQFTDEPYLTHGDLGLHNFIIKGNSISGIIDPIVANSLPILELLFLVASKPNSMPINELINISETLKDSSGFSKKDILALYKVAIYIRIGRACIHHPEDLEKYLEIYHSL